MLKAFRPSSPMVKNWDESVCMCESKSSARLPTLLPWAAPDHPVLGCGRTTMVDSTAPQRKENLGAPAWCCVNTEQRRGLWQKPPPYYSNRQHVRGISRHNTPPSRAGPCSLWLSLSHTHTHTHTHTQCCCHKVVMQWQGAQLSSVSGNRAKLKTERLIIERWGLLIVSERVSSQTGSVWIPDTTHVLVNLQTTSITSGLQEVNTHKPRDREGLNM